MAVELGAGEFYSRSANVPTQTAATILFWCQPAAVAGGYIPLAALFANAAGREIAVLAQQGTDIEIYWTNAGGSSSAGSSGLQLAANQWACFAIVCAGTGIGQTRVYGRILGDTAWTLVSNTSTVDTLTADRVYLHDDGYGSSTGTHRYANAKVWNRALTEDELTAEMYSYFPVSAQDINVHAPLWDTTTDLTDFSGNTRNLALTGTEAAFAAGPPFSDYLTQTNSGRIMAAGGTPGVTGSGNVDNTLPVIAGTGLIGHVGTGNIANTLPVVSGAGVRGVIGSGDILGTLPVIDGSGTGNGAFTGDGAVANTLPVAAGTASTGHPSLGSPDNIDSSIPTISGTGTINAVGGAITGTGAIVGVVPTLNASGVRGRRGTGNVNNTLPVVAGTSNRSRTGTGNVNSTVPTIAGTGVRHLQGSGAITSTRPIISGTDGSNTYDPLDANMSRDFNETMITKMSFDLTDIDRDYPENTVL